MNRKAQEFNPMSILLGIVGAILAWVMASSMHSGLLMKIITALITGVVCYFLSAMIADQ
jgi:uncharacterized membrane protein YeaQ/YmgE (transglycosylase-associated protein family)